MSGGQRLRVRTGVLTSEQDAQLQLDALTTAGVPADNVYVDPAYGA